MFSSPVYIEKDENWDFENEDGVAGSLFLSHAFVLLDLFEGMTDGCKGGKA